MKKFFFTSFTILFSTLLLACSSPPSESFSYSPKVYNIEDSQQKNIFHLNIEEQYLNYIIDGKKIVEGRLNVPDFAPMKIGDLVYFSDGNGNHAICSVTSVGRYDSFNKMLVSDGVVNMLPQIDPDTNSSEEMVIKGTAIYRSFPGYKEGIKIYGSISFGLHYMSDQDATNFHFINVHD